MRARVGRSLRNHFEHQIQEKEYVCLTEASGKGCSGGVGISRAAFRVPGYSGEVGHECGCEGEKVGAVAEEDDEWEGIAKDELS